MKNLCDMCLRRKVDCGIRKFRAYPWAVCRHFREYRTEHDDILEDDGHSAKFDMR